MIFFSFEFYRRAGNGDIKKQNFIINSFLLTLQKKTYFSCGFISFYRSILLNFVEEVSFISVIREKSIKKTKFCSWLFLFNFRVAKLISIVTYLLLVLFIAVFFLIK